jgi:2-C-methyl-D-erythritol 2,4-cyclodiphosphate synthase
MAAHAPRLRIGQGYDVHALVPGRRLVLGGVDIPHDRGLLGHSDADALLHAITDALLGAMAWGDIGSHFPDTDAAFAGADSSVLLAQVVARVRTAGAQIINIDSTVIAQSPKLAPHIASMRAAIAQACGMDISQINVKAKTNEKLGYLGRNEAIEAQAVVLVSLPGAQP